MRALILAPSAPLSAASCRVSEEDGTRYRANRRGQMHVEDAEHVRAMKRDPNVAGDIVEETFHAIDHRPGWRCSCGLAEYQPWTKVCPRCGAPAMTTEEATHVDA